MKKASTSTNEKAVSTKGKLTPKTETATEKKPYVNNVNNIHTHINNNTHIITRNAQEKTGSYITREEVANVDGESEASVERYLSEECKKRGWITFKFTSPGNKGVPDRLVVTRHGIVWFVELKRPKHGRLSKMQKYQILRLEEAGAFVVLLTSRKEVDAFVVHAERWSNL